MREVLFFENLDDERIGCAAVAAQFRGEWVLVGDGPGGAYRIPGCARRDGENIEQTARRALCSLTGAARFRLRHAGAYAVRGDDGSMDYGMLYLAEIQEFFGAGGPGACAGLFSELPENLADPHTLPVLLRRAREVGIDAGA